MKKALIELTKAESLINNWKWLPSSQVRVLISHLIKSLDAITSYALSKETTLNKSYLTLSSYRLFNKKQTELNFYETYFHLNNLLRKNITRINEDYFKVSDYKHEFKADKEYFEHLIRRVKEVVNEANSLL